MSNWNVTVNGGQNQFANNIYNGPEITRVERDIIELINKEVPNELDKKRLVADLLIVKSENDTEEKEESKSRLKDFFETGLNESAKLMTRGIFEKLPDYLSFLGL